MKDKEIVRRPDFKFRFLDTESVFYDYIVENDISPSDALRHFIKQGVKSEGGVSIETQKQLLNELIEIKRTHAGVGRNLNQIARYFNTHEHLVENDLHQTLKVISSKQHELTTLFNQLLKLL
ncbi:hypothetical protein BCT75_04180 [Vibrio lentus]|uniref:plasmid mobilization relaxosome protein MobC n=1 Tax=Vibrio lentus TaxID=136468 RepID=UPI000C827266|nr:plasmid mobilization relaxosome protein MobC [Vibrio lentus]PML45587.1 hypothetical protein BCT75_04180 [Vibrio lentus]